MDRRRLSFMGAIACFFAVPAMSQTQLVWSSFATGSQLNRGAGIEVRSFVGQPITGWSSGNGFSLTSGPAGPIAVLTTTTSLATEDEIAPFRFYLGQNYPNPFNPSTTIEFTVPADGQATVRVYSMLGQLVAVLFDEDASAGQLMKTIFDASNLSGGFYVARLESGGKRLTRKMLLLK